MLLWWERRCSTTESSVLLNFRILVPPDYLHLKFLFSIFLYLEYTLTTTLFSNSGWVVEATRGIIEVICCCPELHTI
ncbi:hypothetical protein P3L10_032563 [Capsicum annuum]